MPGRDLHLKPFDEGTSTKLDLFRGYLREWLPVFVRSPYLEAVQVFDFFAGPGCDVDGKPGSPAIILDEIRSARQAAAGRAPVFHVYFNEFDRKKYDLLTEFLAREAGTLTGIAIQHAQLDFTDAFTGWREHVGASRTASLVFLDQNGVKQVTESVFRTLAASERTDFLFFLSSSMVNRFREQPGIRDRVPVTPADLARMNGTNVHRILAESYQRLLPVGSPYFVAPFSIKKGANVYGLVFGSAHVLGLEKFLRQCWNAGALRGDANFDIDGDGIDPTQPALFVEMDKPKKLAEFETRLEAGVLDETLQTNKQVYEFTLGQGFLPEHARRVFKTLTDKGRLPKQNLHISYDAWRQSEAQAIQRGYTRGD